MPLTKSQIAQRKNSKNRPKNLSTGQFEKKNKASDLVLLFETPAHFLNYF